MLTRLALELEQGPLLGRRSIAEVVQASVVGLGVDVQAFADEDEFGASDAGLMGEAGMSASRCRSGTPSSGSPDRSGSEPSRSSPTGSSTAPSRPPTRGLRASCSAPNADVSS
jgi:hypothetical protein